MSHHYFLVIGEFAEEFIGFITMPLPSAHGRCRPPPPDPEATNGPLQALEVDLGQTTTERSAGRTAVAIVARVQRLDSNLKGLAWTQQRPRHVGATCFLLLLGGAQNRSIVFPDYPL